MIMALTSILSHDPLLCPHCRLRVRLSQWERTGEEDTGRGCLGNQGGRPYAKRQVMDTWKNHTLQLWGDDSR